MLDFIISSAGYYNVMVMSATSEAAWFKNKEMSIAMIVDSIFELIFSTIMFFISPLIMEKTGSLEVCFGVVAVVCIFSIFCALMLAYIDKYAPVYVNTDEDREVGVLENSSFKIFANLGYGFWILTISHVAYEGIYMVFTNVVVTYFKARFKLNDKTNSFVNGGMPMLVSALAIPLGIVIYKYGRKVHISTLYTDY